MINKVIKSYVVSVTLVICLSNCSEACSVNADSQINLQSTLASTEQKVLYVNNPLSSSTSYYKIDPVTGDLVRLGNFYVDGAPGDINVYKNKFMYFALNLKPSIKIATIANDGTLSNITTPQAKTGLSPWSTAIIGDFAYTGNTNSNSISMFRIESNTGKLTQLRPSEINIVHNLAPSGITANPNNPRFLYVAGWNSNLVEIFKRNPDTGILQATNQTYLVGTKPRGLWFDYNNHGYVLNFNSATISQFKVESNGELIPLSPATINVGNEPMHIITSNKIASGEYAYVASRNSNSISVFCKNKDGSLIIQSIIKNCLSGPRFLQIDRIKQRIYISNMFSNTISKFNILPDGNLDEKSCNQYYAGISPEVMELVSLKD